MHQLASAYPNGNRRLGIPNLSVGEACHGVVLAGATSFPQSVGLGATWDPELVEQIGQVIGQEGRALGVHQVFAPMLGLARDPRWGRGQETYGEDPFLTGEMGTIIRLVRGHKLYDETLAKMVPFLKSIDFRGNVDINCIVNAEGLFPLEFTFGRFGYPAIYIEMEGHKKPWGEFLYACATRKDIEDPGSKESKWLIGVVIAGQGYPFYKDAGADKMNLMPVILGSGPEEKETMKHVQLCDICAVGPKKDIYTINAYVGCATAAGETIDDAQDKVYALLPKIKVPNTYYRIDIGDRVINEMAELEDLGYGFAESEEEEKE